MSHYPPIPFSLFLVLATLWLTSCSIYEEPQTLSRSRAQDRLTGYYSSMDYIESQINNTAAFETLDSLSKLLPYLPLAETPQEEEEPDVDDDAGNRERPDSNNQKAKVHSTIDNTNIPYIWALQLIPATIFNLISCEPYRPNSTVDLIREFNADRMNQYINATNERLGSLDFVDSLGNRFEGHYTWSDSLKRWIADLSMSGRFRLTFPYRAKSDTDTVHITVSNFARETYMGSTFIRSVVITLDLSDDRLLTLNYTASLLRGVPELIRFNVRVGSWRITRSADLSLDPGVVQIKSRHTLREGSKKWLGSNFVSLYNGSSSFNPYTDSDHDYTLSRLDGYLHQSDIKIEYRVDATSYSRRTSIDAANSHILLDVYTYPNADWVGLVRWGGGGGSGVPDPLIEFSDGSTTPATKYIPQKVLLFDGFEF